MSDTARTAALTAWVEVDRDALAHNLRQVRSLVGPEVRVLAVVKADAYGHGAVEAARVFAAAGADFLGVTRVEEALELRDAGIEAPVLVFGAALPEQAETVVARNLTQTICNLESAQALSAAAGAAGRRVPVHVKVDSGMGRLGVPSAALVDFLREVQALPHLEVQALYTHFATALSPDHRFLSKQLKHFLRAAAAVDKAGLGNPMLHAANSAALLTHEVARLDMVRAGTILYGQYPAPNLPRLLDLRETWRLKTRVTQIKQVKRGDTIGYGRDFRARRPMTVATIALGYCDGLTLAPARTSRSLRELLNVARDFLRRGRAGVRIQGCVAPYVGRVSMQMACVDVSHIPGVKVGDEVIVPARRTVTSAHIPRVYLGTGQE